MVSVPRDVLLPHEWLEQQPLKEAEQLFAVFSSASIAQPLKTWQRSIGAKAPTPIWADTPYAEWEPVMPYVGIVAADSEFLQWVATTTSCDWGWLAVSSASQEALIEHFRSLTQVLLPNGNPVFFRFWDGRFLWPILQSADIDAAQLLPVIGRCLINGQPVEIGGRAVKTQKVFPWWEVPDSVLQALGAGDLSTLLSNLLQWLSEEQPGVFEAFSEEVLRSKVAHFLSQPELSPAPKEALLAYLMDQQG
jgi:hypothetical protein